MKNIANTLEVIKHVNYNLANDYVSELTIPPVRPKLEISSFEPLEYQPIKSNLFNKPRKIGGEFILRKLIPGKRYESLDAVALYFGVSKYRSDNFGFGFLMNEYDDGLKEGFNDMMQKMGIYEFRLK